jgi:hypothetical protein
LRPIPPRAYGDLDVVAVALALALAAAPIAPAAASPAGPEQALEKRRAGIAEELIRLGAAIQREIERGDVEALVARVPPDGLRCGGRVVPRARVARDLRAPGSWLHGFFFGGPAAPDARGQPGSLRALFAAAPEIAVLVAFRRDARAGPVGRPCLDFRAKRLATPGAPLCFEARDGRWWFTESLYPCG